jgi:hypothetical protein
MLTKNKIFEHLIIPQELQFLSWHFLAPQHISQSSPGMFLDHSSENLLELTYYHGPLVHGEVHF